MSKSIKCWEYPGILVIKIDSSPCNHKFNMRAGDISLGAFYYGKITIVDAARPDIIGHTFTDWYDFTKPENHRFNEWGQWMVCRVEDDAGWRCFHSECGTYKGIELLVVSEDTILTDKPAVILDGNFYDSNKVYEAMDYVEHSNQLSGTGRLVIFHEQPV